jgi:hypothetical protein
VDEVGGRLKRVYEEYFVLVGVVFVEVVPRSRYRKMFIERLPRSGVAAGPRPVATGVAFAAQWADCSEGTLKCPLELSH